MHGNGQHSMKYDPDKHHRQSIRLKGYDYTQANAYFVTVCTRDRECLFDDPVLRRITEECWLYLPCHFPNVVLDEWVLMPNHFHGILVLGEAFPGILWDGGRHGAKGGGDDDQVSAGNASPLPWPPPHLAPHSLGALIGNFKSLIARRVNATRNAMGAPVWQGNYYEHVIRDREYFDRTRENVINNPLNWQSDENNPSNLQREEWRRE